MVIINAGFRGRRNLHGVPKPVARFYRTMKILVVIYWATKTVCHKSLEKKNNNNIKEKLKLQNLDSINTIWNSYKGVFNCNSENNEGLSNSTIKKSMETIPMKRILITCKNFRLYSINMPNTLAVSEENALYNLVIWLNLIFRFCVNE